MSLTKSYRIFVLVFLVQGMWALETSAPSADASSTMNPMAPFKPFALSEQQRKDFTRRGEVVAAILERYHYSRVRLTPETVDKYFKTWIDYLDYNHMIFYQEDIDQLRAKWLPTLDQALLKGEADFAVEVFNRFMMRFEEKEQLAQKLLKEKYDFNLDESFLPDRSKESFPKDNLEAEKIWRSRVKYELLTGRLNKEKQDETVKLLSRRYNRRLREFKEYTLDDVVSDSLKSLSRVFDPHSDFYTDEELKEFKEQTIELKIYGIGAELGIEDGYAKVRRVMPGSPAESSKKINANDRIVAVAQGNEKPVDVVDMPLRKIVRMIRGKEGTEVRLTIIPADAPDPTLRQVVSIIRGEIELKDAKARGRLIEYQDPSNKKLSRIGVIQLPQFYDNCSADIEKFLRRFEQERVQGIVLDMRLNGGGLLDEAIKVTGLFIPKGPVVQVRDSGGSIRVHEDENGAVAYSGPLVMMVGHQSASATEIVAAALQDYGRGVVVGDSQTHGKGTVQIIQEMDKLRNFWDPTLTGAIKFTIQKFYRISGGSTQHKGVVPDIPIPSLLDTMEIGERFLPNNLPFDEIPPLKYRKAEDANELIQALRKNSGNRLSKSDEFKELTKEMEFFKKRLVDKRVSLQESKRVQEKNELKARVEHRNKLRKEIAQKTDKNWNITLDDLTANRTLEEIAKKPPEKIAVSQKEDSEEQEEDESLRDVNDLQLSEGVQILLDLSQNVRHKPST